MAIACAPFRGGSRRGADPFEAVRPQRSGVPRRGSWRLPLSGQGWTSGGPGGLGVRRVAGLVRVVARRRFGELAVLGKPHRRTATVVAWEPAETLSLTGAAFKALCRDNPTIERLVLTFARRARRRVEPPVDRGVVCQRRPTSVPPAGRALPHLRRGCPRYGHPREPGRDRRSCGNKPPERQPGDSTARVRQGSCPPRGRHIVVLRPDELMRQARR